MSLFKCKKFVFPITSLGIGISISSSSFLEAASIEAEDAWSSDMRVSGTMISGNRALIRNGSGRDDIYKVYLDRPLVSVRLMSPSGSVEFFGVFNLETLVRRHVKLNASSERHSPFDDQQTRRVIENLTATVQASEKIVVTAGVGTVAFMQPIGSVVSQYSLQDEVHQLRERLFVETAYIMDNGTTVQVSIFDGARQKAVDLTRSFGIDDFLDFERSGSDSISGAIKVNRPLGSTGIHAFVAYALVRNPAGRSGQNHMVSMGFDATYELGEWVIYGLLQFVQVWGQENLNSVLGEIVAEKGRLALYTQGERTYVPSTSSKERVFRGSLGAKYKIVQNDSFTLSPFAEIYAESRRNQSSDLGLILGSSVEFGTHVELGSRKSE
jgi:hypothetical protein